VRTSREDLFAPSLQGEARVEPLTAGERPWQLSSQFYVAFFGGALAVTAIAWLNAKRLRAPAETQRWILMLGGLGVVASVVVSYVLYGNDFGSATRIGYRVVAVLLAGAFYKLLQPADRVYSFRSPVDEDEQYDPMWIPGLLATVVGGAVQLGLVFGGIALIDAAVG
jgi:drug/metabolite transporter (DMT)-like permease